MTRINKNITKEKLHHIARNLLGFAPFAKNIIPDEPVIPLEQAVEIVVNILEKEIDRKIQTLSEIEQAMGFRPGSINYEMFQQIKNRILS